VPIAVAVSGARSCRLAGEKADIMIAEQSAVRIEYEPDA
jgi:hypothetical protein